MAREMKLRIYAAIVTLGLIAALTNPSKQNHYDKLSSFHFWVNESLLTEQEMEMRLQKGDDAPSEPMTQAEWAEYERHPLLSYWNFGLASAVTSYPRYVPCPYGVRDTYLSFGIFGFVFVNRQTDVARSSEPSSPAGKYEASFDLNSPFAKGLVPDNYLAKLNNDTRFHFSVTFSDQDSSDGKEFDRQIQGLKLKVENLERNMEKMPQAERSRRSNELDILRNKLTTVRLKKAEIQNTRYVSYHSECSYSSKNPAEDAKLRDDYDLARETYKRSLRSSSLDEEERLARAEETYHRLRGIPPFQDSEHGEGGWRLEDRKVYCDLLTIRRSQDERLPPYVDCRLPGRQRVRIVFRIQRNGDLVVESVAPVKGGPPVGLTFTKQ